MTKRIRVEMDVSDVEAEGWETYRGVAGLQQYQFVVTSDQVRSVEVVEPQRWTELTLRRDEHFPTFSPGEHVGISSDRVMAVWTVVSCEQIESYE